VDSAQLLEPYQKWQLAITRLPANNITDTDP